MRGSSIPPNRAPTCPAARPWVLLFLCLTLWGSAASRAHAADSEVAALNRAQHAALASARQLLELGAGAQSISEINALLPTVQDQPYAHAIAQLALGVAHQRGGELAAAEQAFTMALAANVLPAALRHDVEYQLAHVLIRRGRDRDGLRVLERWLNGEAQPSADARRLAALAYTRAGRCDLALPQLLALRAAGGALDAAWAQALRSCQGELTHHGSTTALVRDLLHRHPTDKRVWMQGVGMYRDAGQEREAVALLEILAGRGQLDSGEVLELARTYAALGTPLRAAHLIEESIAAGHLPRARGNLELLGHAWRAGHEYERAIATYRAIVATQPDGNLYFAIGELSYALGHRREAIEALQAALRQPVLRQVAVAQLLLGIAAFEQGDHDLARSALAVAHKAPETRAAAQWWLEQADSRAADG